MKFLRTIRFDDTDTRVFDTPAAPDEWAISGAFAFARMAPEEITGKARQAFANGFLGLASFGRATFTVVADLDESELERLHHVLGLHFVSRYGAPDLAAALPVAREECAFIADLCSDAAINTVFAVARSFDADGRIREAFRIVTPPTDEPLHARVWAVEPDSD